MAIVGGGQAPSSIVSGVTVTGTAAAGQAPIASSSSAGVWAYPPGFEVGYDQRTTNLTVASATEATGTTVITCAAHVFDGSPVCAHFYSGQIAPDTGDFIVVNLFESTTQIGRLGIVQGTVATGLSAWLRFTPTAASHTYVVTAFRGSVNGTILAGAGGTGALVPSFIRFTKV